MRKLSNTLWSDGRTRLFAHHANLLSLCRRIGRYWTPKMRVGYILSIVCLRVRKFLQLYLIQYMGLCVFRLMIVRIHVLYFISILKWEVWPICHCLGSGHEKMVCLSIYLFRVRPWKNGVSFYIVSPHYKNHCYKNQVFTSPKHWNVVFVLKRVADYLSLCLRWAPKGQLTAYSPI